MRLHFHYPRRGVSPLSPGVRESLHSTTQSRWPCVDWHRKSIFHHQNHHHHYHHRGRLAVTLVRFALHALYIHTHSYIDTDVIAKIVDRIEERERPSYSYNCSRMWRSVRRDHLSWRWKSCNCSSLLQLHKWFSTLYFSLWQMMSAQIDEKTHKSSILARFARACTYSTLYSLFFDAIINNTITGRLLFWSSWLLGPCAFIYFFFLPHFLLACSTFLFTSFIYFRFDTFNWCCLLVWIGFFG